MPVGFGPGEFTYELSVLLDAGAPYGETSGGANQRNNWATEDDTRYTPNWWFKGNFSQDGHNNNNFSDGTFSLQFYGSGRPRWTFGDGSSQTGDAVPVPLVTGVFGIQPDPTTSLASLRDGEWHKLAMVRRFVNVSDSDLELWVDNVLVATQRSALRTNMATSYWDTWTNWPQTGWYYGGEKQVIDSPGQYEDHKGRIARPAFFSGAKSVAELQAITHAIDTGHPDYLDHWELDEGTGVVASSEVGGLALRLDTGNVNAGWGSL